MVFRDQLVRCGACGTEFVYTVREQRRRAEQGQSLEPPAFCAACRGADARLAEAVDTRASSPAPAGARGASSSPDRPRGAGRGRGPERRGGERRGGGPERGRGGNRRGGHPGRGGRRGQPQTEMRFRYVGEVKWFDDDKGYGFIAQDEDGQELFVHSSGIIVEGVRSLREGQSVEYEVEHTPRGLQAIDVVPLD